MNPKGRRYQKQYAVELVAIAEGDLGSAEILAKTTGGRPENVCYLSHQAVEKSLKAVLCHLELTLMHTHDLDILVAMLPDEHQPPDAHKLGALTQYSLVRRYEEGYEILTPEDLNDTVDLARTVVTWAKNKIIPEKQKSK